VLLKWEEESDTGKLLRKFARSANSSFAFASQPIPRRPNQVALPVAPGNSNWAPTLVMHGQVNHLMGPLETPAGAAPMYAAVWVVDAAFREDATAQTRCRVNNITWPNLSAQEKLLRRPLMDYLFVRAQPLCCPSARQILSPHKCSLWAGVLQERIETCNPFVSDFLNLMKLPAASVQEYQFVISAERRPEGEHLRRYNVPDTVQLSEVAVLYRDDAPGSTRDLVLRRRAPDGAGRLLTRISQLHRAFDPLHYVLLFPEGDDQWSIDMPYPRRGGAAPAALGDAAPAVPGAPGAAAVRPPPTVSIREYYAFHNNTRPGTQQRRTLFFCQRLYQEWVCMAWAKVRTPPSDLRARLSAVCGHCGTRI
jgi:hypothetical protein